MLINDIKVQDEKIVIITEDQILKALGLSNKKYELYDVLVEYTGNRRIVVKVKTKEEKIRSINMNFIESRTLDSFMDE